MAGPGWEWGALRSRRGTKPGKQRYQCGDPQQECPWPGAGLQMDTQGLAEGHEEPAPSSQAEPPSLWESSRPRHSHAGSPKGSVVLEIKVQSTRCPDTCPKGRERQLCCGTLAAPTPKSSCLHPADGQLLVWAAPLQRETAQRCWLERLRSVGGRETLLQAGEAEVRAASAKPEAQVSEHGSLGSSKVEQSFSFQGAGG